MFPTIRLPLPKLTKLHCVKALIWALAAVLFAVTYAASGVDETLADAQKEAAVATRTVAAADVRTEAAAPMRGNGVEQVTQCYSGVGATAKHPSQPGPSFNCYGDDSIDMLPAWRWQGATALYDTFGLTNIAEGIESKFASILFLFANFLWSLVLALIKFAFSVNVLERVGGSINAGFAAVGTAMFSSGIAQMIVLFGFLSFGVAVAKGKVSGGLGKLFAIVFPVAMLMALTNGASATAPTGGTWTDENARGSNVAPGSPVWIAAEGSRYINEIAGGFGAVHAPLAALKSDEGAAGNGAEAITPSCQAYSTVLYDAYDIEKKDEGGKSLMAASKLWESSMGMQWTAAQYGGSPSGARMYCHQLEGVTRIPVAEQHLIGYAAGYPDTPLPQLEGGEYKMNGEKVDDPSNAFGPYQWNVRTDKGQQAVLFGWAACGANANGELHALRAWAILGGMDGEICDEWWKGNLPAKNRTGPIPDDYKMQWSDNSVRQDSAKPITSPVEGPKISDGTGNTFGVAREDSMQDAADAVLGFRGKNAGSRMQLAIIAVITAIVYVYALGLLAGSAVIAQVGLAIMLVLLPGTLVMLALAGNGNQGRHPLGKRMMYMTLGFMASKLIITAGLMLLIVLINLLHTLIPGSPGSVFSALIPLAAIFVMRKLTKSLGLGSMMSPKAALGMATSAAMATGAKPGSRLQSMQSRTAKSAAKGKNRRQKLGRAARYLDEGYQKKDSFGNKFNKSLAGDLKRFRQAQALATGDKAALADLKALDKKGELRGLAGAKALLPGTYRTSAAKARDAAREAIGGKNAARTAGALGYGGPVGDFEARAARHRGEKPMLAAPSLNGKGSEQTAQIAAGFDKAGKALSAEQAAAKDSPWAKESALVGHGVTVTPEIAKANRELMYQHWLHELEGKSGPEREALIKGLNDEDLYQILMMQQGKVVADGRGGYLPALDHDGNRVFAFEERGPGGEFVRLVTAEQAGFDPATGTVADPTRYAVRTDPIQGITGAEAAEAAKRLSMVTGIDVAHIAQPTNGLPPTYIPSERGVPAAVTFDDDVAVEFATRNPSIFLPDRLHQKIQDVCRNDDNALAEAYQRIEYALGGNTGEKVNLLATVGCDPTTIQGRAAALNAIELHVAGEASPLDDIEIPDADRIVNHALAAVSASVRPGPTVVRSLRDGVMLTREDKLTDAQNTVEVIHEVQAPVTRALQLHTTLENISHQLEMAPTNDTQTIRSLITAKATTEAHLTQALSAVDLDEILGALENALGDAVTLDTLAEADRKLAAGLNVGDLSAQIRDRVDALRAAEQARAATITSVDQDDPAAVAGLLTSLYDQIREAEQKLVASMGPPPPRSSSRGLKPRVTDLVGQQSFDYDTLPSRK